MPIDKLRAVSNLSIPKQFKLPRAKQRSGFLLIYSGKFHEDSYSFLCSLLFQPFFKQTQIDDYLKNRKDLRMKPNDFMKVINLHGIANKCVLRKSGLKDKKNGLYFDVPLRIGDMSKQLVMSTLTWKQTEGNDVENSFTGNEVQPGFHPFSSFKNKLTLLSKETIASLDECLLGLEVKEDAGEGSKQIWAKFFIDKPEAEFMSSTPFQAMRLGNMYVPLQNWVFTDFGDRGRLPISSIPITAIANLSKGQTQHGDVSPKNKVDGIVAMEDGDLMWIPDVEAAVDYEQGLHDYGIQDDGSYTFDQSSQGAAFHVNGDDENEGHTKKKLPINMPVYTDWVNLKFAYSQTNGILSVIDLDRAVPLRPFHVRSVLDTELVKKGINTPWAYLSIAYNVATQINESISAQPTDEEIEAARLHPNIQVNDINEYVEKVMEQAIVHKLGGNDIVYKTDIKIKHLSKDSPIVGLRCIGRALEKAHKTCQEHIDNVYKRYSVLTTVQFMAQLMVFAKYAHKFDDVVKKDDERREAYINQGIDSKHKPISVPNIKNDLTFLPHQAKAENLMRKGPRYAIYNVQAGGGKTILILTNILREIKDKKCRRPIVMCPAHLVSGYVKEAVYVTEGKVNIIPITVLTMKYHGPARIAKMIQKAPINTIFVTDFNFIKGGQENIGYGVKTITLFRNVEFLRQFKFDLVAMDESHYLKNVSSRTEAAHRFVSEIPMKRLASGTLAHDTPMDIVAQFALLDPTVFGSREDFMNEYADEVRGGKIMSWKTGAQQAMHRKMRQHCVFVDCKRKEWAALLPNPDETFHGVDLTPKQSMVYQSVLEQTMEMIHAAMQKDKGLKKAMEDAEDENKFESLAALLKPYLSRLEQFLAAPGRDVLGKEVLTEPDDLMSPKTKKIIELCNHHINTNIYGKILIFTNHIEVAEDIYESLPPALKKKTIHYKSGEKMEAKAEFENNPNKLIMVGVEKSMNTGLNFQFASRLIRVETVWTPGEMEQGNARLNRPELKKKEMRDAVYFDWIVVNRTFDITKCSRLIAKTIQNSKFEEPENLAYQQIEEPDMVPMTLDTIQFMNDWETSLSPYLEAYKEYRTVLYKDYKDYKEKNKDNMTPTAIPNAGILTGSALMSRVPYVPDMELYGADQLGLVRYNEFMRKDDEYELQDDDGDDDDDDLDDDTMSATKKANLEEAKKVLGLGVHTDQGEGEIIGVSKFRVKVRLNTGEITRARKIACFIITRKDTNNKDIRNQLLKLAGKLPIEAPIDVPAAIMRPGKPVKEDKKNLKKTKEKINEEVEEEISAEVEVELGFTIVNDFLGIMFKDMENANAVNALSQHGFRILPPYYWTKVANIKVMVQLFKAWADKGFEWPNWVNKRLKSLFDQMKIKNLNMFGLSVKLDLHNFFMREYKPSTEAKQIKPYPIIRDDVIYMALPAKAQVGTKNAIKVPVPSIKWVYDAGEEMICFVANKDAAKKVIGNLIKSGVTITNQKQLQKEWDKLKIVKRKQDKGG
jgi:hypothetical protein